MIRRSTSVAIAFPRGVRLGAGLLGLLLIAAAAIPSARAETVYSIRVRLNPNAVAAGALSASHQARLEALARHEAHAGGNDAHRRARARARRAAGRRGSQVEARRDAHGPVGAVGRDGGAEPQREGTACRGCTGRARCRRVRRRRPQAPRAARGRPDAGLDHAAAPAQRADGRRRDSRTADRQRLGAATHVAGAHRRPCADGGAPRGGSRRAVRRPGAPPVREAGSERPVLPGSVGADRSRWTASTSSRRGTCSCRRPRPARRSR